MIWMKNGRGLVDLKQGRSMESVSKKGLCLSALIAINAQLAPTVVDAAVLIVPTTYATIQAAVDAANVGDRIQVLAGTYVEQLSIAKDLKLTGAGLSSTVIRAPDVLVPGQLGDNNIVEIYGGASVRLSRLTISGPGAGTCENGALKSGIRVFDGAHLDLKFAAVTRIHDTPIFGCFRSGHGIQIGDPATDSTGTATIRHSDINEYQGVGIIVLNEGSTAVVSHNIVTGPGLSTVVATDGIELVLGAVGTISHNIVSGNACGSPALGCGPDFFQEFQHAGIVGGAEGTVISQNVLYGNQVGIYVADVAEISHNVLANNDYFGIALQDGSFTVSHDRIWGGAGGIAAIAAFADTKVVLNQVKIDGTSGAPVQEFECCGFTATVIGGP